MGSSIINRKPRYIFKYRYKSRVEGSNLIDLPYHHTSRASIRITQEKLPSTCPEISRSNISFHICSD